MKIFYIVVIIFIIIGFLKFRLMLFLNNDEGIKITLKVMIIKLFEYPSKKKDKNFKYDKNYESDKKKFKKKKFKKKKKKNILQIFSILKILILPLPKLLKFLNKGLKITNLKIIMKVAGEDAKKTALDYSKNVSFVFNLLAVLQQYCKIKKKDILILPNFLDEESKYELIMKMKISIGRIIIGILMYLCFIFIGLLSKKIY